MQVVQAPGPGGPIETWIASPAEAGDDPLPTIVDVHGGPLGAWAPAPSVEVVLLCGAGYRVVLPNIRGSTSYGRDWIRPHLGHWGEVDAEDVHAALDHAVALGLADPDRLGALGLSYGGFMVNWLMGTTRSLQGRHHATAAWRTRSPTGRRATRASISTAGRCWERRSTRRASTTLWRQSPLANVANIHTPLLIFQGEEDRRCPPSDNEQLFVALRVLGRTVEYILYPEESHVFFTSGRPDRRIDRMTRMLDWFDRYVRGDEGKR